MAKNIFEELVEEIEKTLGGSLKIKVRVEVENPCFKDFDKEKLREAFQKTVSFVIKNTELKRFSFKDEELSNVSSLTAALLRLVSGGMNSLVHAPFNDERHFLECVGCQMILFRTIEKFTSQLLNKKAGGIQEKIGIAVLPLPIFDLPLFLKIKMFLDTEEKWQIFQKYIPLFVEKEIPPEKVLEALTETFKDKGGDLEKEEIEMVLKNLVSK